MKWEVLKDKIIKECKFANKSEKYTSAYLEYCRKLYEKELPIIASPKHFSLLVGIDHEYVCKMAYSQNLFYRSFKINKSNGKKREIKEPLPDLKYVQKWILNNILNKVEVSDYAKAFVKNRTLKHNAKFHKKQNVVVTLDIKDFFPSITLYDVADIFKDLGYFENVALFLANLCCYKKQLPQGAPTSPYLSNLRFRKIDDSISSYTKELNIRYTRYADDMTFSGDFNPHQLIKKISDIIHNSGFNINSKKTRVAYKNARQEVTGIVVNSHMQVSKNKRRDIRQQVYYIKKFGLDSHLTHIQETRANYLNHLLGQINFCLFVNPKDNEMKQYFGQIKDLMQKQNSDD
ncbi:MAG: retron St85 family RNA-directed DNA polymerase [Bacilli bacterium]|nr:retron St85 family RNA-directed DNA polymerase [Bacilli bacterium]